MGSQFGLVLELLATHHLSIDENLKVKQLKGL